MKEYIQVPIEEVCTDVLEVDGEFYELDYMNEMYAIFVLLDKYNALKGVA